MAATWTEGDAVKKLSAVAVALALAMVAAAVTLPPAIASPEDELQAVRAATAPYHSVEQALSAGYVAPPECVASPMGGMGYHFENPALMEDSILDATRPEMLLYARKSNGKLELVAVEYYLEADQASGMPQLFGQAFQGPMPAHHPGMETHYDLHVWLWEDNPSGTFAEWNPNVSCPA
jgi:hypothetical protein